MLFFNILIFFLNQHKNLNRLFGIRKSIKFNTNFPTGYYHSKFPYKFSVNHIIENFIQICPIYLYRYLKLK